MSPRHAAHHDDQPAAETPHDDKPAGETPAPAAAATVTVKANANLAFVDIGQTVTVAADDPEIRALIANGVLEEQ